MRKIYLLLTCVLINLIVSAQDYTQLYVVGAATSIGWDANNALPMTKIDGSDGVFTWTGLLKGGEFKFINQLGSWGNSVTAKGDGFTALDNTYDMLFNDASDRKFIAASPGLYTLTVDFKNLKMTYGSAAPKVGLLFNGTANSFIDLQNSAIGITNFTIETWLFYNSVPSGTSAYILSTEDSPNAIAQGFSLRTDGSKLQLCIGNGNWVTVKCTSVLEAATWYHVAVTCSDTQINIYINGILEGTTALLTPIIPSAKLMRIGDSPSWPGRLLDGVISDLRFWNVVRTANEISTNNTILLNGTETGLVSNWKMNEGDGLTVSDQKNVNTITKPNDVTWFSGIPKVIPITNSSISCDNKDIENAYNLAIKIIGGNVRGGILAAGAEYNAGWTRDCSINNWFGVSLINPTVAKESMWNVTNNKVTIGAEYWDRIIWVIAALDYYKVNGDLDFLQQAYTCSVNSMKIQEDNYFDNTYGLFKGESVFNDGISGYPQPVYDPTINSGAAADFPNTKLIKCLSTNSVYYGAYKALIEMANILAINNATVQSYSTKANAIKSNILKYLYSDTENKTYYLIDNLGNTAKYQEGLGISLATILGVLTPDQAKKVIAGVTVSKFGITSIYPDFKEFSPSKPGRHNNIIWPHVNAFFAQASIAVNDTTAFLRELNGITKLALDKDKGNYDFCEVYNPYSGVPDGGWQNGGHWPKVTRQTWCATGYMNMVYYGLLGMRFDKEGIAFSPFLPSTVNSLELKDLPYRQSVLDIIVTGKGTKIKSFSVNGQSQVDFRINATLQGNIKIEIVMEKASSTLSTIEIKNKPVLLFPNPADDTISISEVPANKFISIKNLSGKTVFTTKSSVKTENFSINISNLIAGTYIVTIGNASEKSFKFVKK